VAPLTFQSLRAILLRERGGRSDRHWHPRRDRLRVRKQGEQYALSVASGQGLYELDPQAFRQLCDRFGLSAELVSHLEELAPTGAAELLDKLLWNDGRDPARVLLARVDATTRIRAILSPQYTPFDALDVLDAIQRPLESAGWTPYWYEISDRWVRLDFARREEEYDIAPGSYTGDGVRPGLSFVTSEVGEGAVQVAPCLIRRRNRSKIALPWPGGKVSLSHRHLVPAAMAARLAEVALTSLPFGAFAAGWKATHAVSLTEPQATHHLSQWHVPGGKAARDAILSRFGSEGRPSLFRLVGAAAISLVDGDGPTRWRAESAIGATVGSYVTLGTSLPPAAVAAPAAGASAPSPVPPASAS
jgi:hypothetical protein